jgi:aminoglycoside phosphotransferase (APT) family kinase protein
MIPGVAVDAAANLVPLRYKPERRFVGRLDVNGLPQAVVRVHSLQAYRAARRAAKSLDGGSVLRLPAILGHSHRHRILVQEWTVGESLQESMARGEDPTLILSRAGAALAALHAEVHHKLPARPVETDARGLARISRDARFFGASLAGKVERLSQRCASRLLATHPLLVTTHGDLHPGQILFDERDRVVIIDLDEAARAPSCLDLGNMIAHLERAELQGTHSAAQTQTWSQALLTGYREAGGKADDSELRSHVAASLLRQVHEPFRHREVGWRDSVLAMLDRAGNLLDAQHVTVGATRADLDPELAGDAPWGRGSGGNGGAGRSSIAREAQEDQRLPQLAATLSLDVVRQPITELVRDCFGDKWLTLVRVRKLRHKPGRRALIGYDFQHHQSSQLLTVVGKVQAKPRHARSLRLQQALWESGFDAACPDRICVPRPVGMLPEWNMWLQEFVPGESGWNALDGPQASQVAAQVAAAVIKLAAAGIATARTHQVDDELHLLNEKLPVVAQQHPAWSQRIERILAACQDLGARLRVRPRRAIHRDFYPDQMVVTGRRLWILDHDLYCYGDPCLDIGNFCAHLVEYGIRHPERSATYRRAAQTLVERFVSREGADSLFAIEAYTTLSLVRHIYLSTRFPSRRGTTAQVLELCERRLDVAAQGERRIASGSAGRVGRGQG